MDELERHFNAELSQIFDEDRLARYFGDEVFLYVKSRYLEAESELLEARKQLEKHKVGSE